MLSTDALYNVRRATNVFAQVLATLATLFGLFWLAWIVYTTLTNGLAALDLDLFTKMTPPPGDDGGMLNAIFGSIAMSLLGVLFGAPIGVLAGTYLAEFARTRWSASSSRARRWAWAWAPRAWCSRSWSSRSSPR